MFNFSLELSICSRSLRLVPKFGPVTEQPSKSTLPITTNSPHPFERFSLMAIQQITDSQQIVYTITGEDKKHNPAPLPAGSVQFSTDNPDLLKLVPGTDGTSVTIVATGPLGTATVTSKVLAPDQTTLAAGSVDIQVTAGPVANIVMTPGTPTEQP